MSIITHVINSVPVEQSFEDGYMNLNQIAQASQTGKRVDNWMRLKETTSLLREFEMSPIYQGLQPIIAKEGKNGGTWGHPDIVIQFSQWCSPAFALAVSRIVRERMTGKPIEEPQPPLFSEFDRTAHLIRTAQAIGVSPEEFIRLHRELQAPIAPVVETPKPSKDSDRKSKAEKPPRIKGEGNPWLATPYEFPDNWKELIVEQITIGEATTTRQVIEAAIGIPVKDQTAHMKRVVGAYLKTFCRSKKILVNYAQARGWIPLHLPEASTIAQ